MFYDKIVFVKNSKIVENTYFLSRLHMAGNTLFWLFGGTVNQVSLNQVLQVRFFCIEYFGLVASVEDSESKNSGCERRLTSKIVPTKRLYAVFCSRCNFLFVAEPMCSRSRVLRVFIKNCVCNFLSVADAAFCCKSTSPRKKRNGPGAASTNLELV